MIAILLWLVELPDGGFLSAGVPLVLAVFLPAVEARLMLPLIGAAAQHEGLLLPDTAPGQIKTRIGKCPAEVQPFGVCVENIDAVYLTPSNIRVRNNPNYEPDPDIARCEVLIESLRAALDGKANDNPNG